MKLSQRERWEFLLWLALSRMKQTLVCWNLNLWDISVMYWPDADPELDFWGSSDSFYCLFHVRSSLIKLFAVEHISIWEGPLSPQASGSAPGVFARVLEWLNDSDNQSKDEVVDCSSVFIWHETCIKHWFYQLDKHCISWNLCIQGTASAKEFYKRHHKWTEGLLSAAKSVGWGASILV